jgi:ribosome-binding factor A
MSAHTEQVASVLRRAVQGILTHGLNDPRVRGLISVTGVTVTDDLADATVLVSIHPEEHAPLAIMGIQHATGHIRAELLRSLDMRRVPRLQFRLDDSLKRQAAIHAAIGRAALPADDEEPPGEKEEQ